MDDREAIKKERDRIKTSNYQYLLSVPLEPEKEEIPAEAQEQ